MDRRYLLATLAIVATFAVVSQEMRDGRVAVLAMRQMGAITGRCDSNPSAPERIVGEMTARLEPGHAEEAQMLAEMNLPVVRAQARAAAMAAREQVRATQCARETAMREAERARRDAQRAQADARRMTQSMAIAVTENAVHPIAFRMEKIVFDNQRMQQAMKLQVTQEQAERVQNAVDLAVAKLDTTNFLPPVIDADSNVRCQSARSWSQVQSRYTRVMRNAVHAFQNSLHTSSTGIGSNAGYL